MHETWHILQVLFEWPNGIVVGNLIAAVIWAPLGALAAVLHLDKLAKKHHAERMAQVHETHQLVQQIHAKVHGTEGDQ